MIYSDKSLSQKLERTEARANASFVETRARLEPSTGATWIEVAGAYAMFDGPGSPCTQTFGLGLFDNVGGEHLAEIEEFYLERSAPVFHEVSPMTDPSLMQILSARDYSPIELTSVMYRELGPGIELETKNANITTRVISDDEVELWAATSAGGWATEMEGLADFMLVESARDATARILSSASLTERLSRPGCCLSTTTSASLPELVRCRKDEIKEPRTLCSRRV
jgi:hypothetical protein